MNKLFLSILTIFTIQGCVLKETSDYYKFKYILSTKITDFKEPTEKLVLQMNDKLLAISPSTKNFCKINIQRDKQENVLSLDFIY